MAAMLLLTVRLLEEKAVAKYCAQCRRTSSSAVSHKSVRASSKSKATRRKCINYQWCAHFFPHPLQTAAGEYIKVHEGSSGVQAGLRFSNAKNLK